MEISLERGMRCEVRSKEDFRFRGPEHQVVQNWLFEFADKR